MNLRDTVHMASCTPRRRRRYSVKLARRMRYFRTRRNAESTTAGKILRSSSISNSNSTLGRAFTFNGGDR
jgi:hypothetical protein